MFTRDNVPFCAVCRRAIEAILDLYTPLTLPTTSGGRLRTRLTSARCRLYQVLYIAAARLALVMFL